MSSDTGRTPPEARDAGAAVPPPAADPALDDGAPGTDVTPGNDTPVTLPPREREMLAFERQWWRRAGAKETAIRDLFGVPPTRYYQVLNALVDRPEALASDPLLVRRLRRLRSARQQKRSSRGPVQ